MRNAAQHRANASLLLRMAGDKGLSRSELQAAMGTEDKATLFYLRTPGLAVKGETKAHELTRWFAPEFAEAARAYVEACDSRERVRFGPALLDQACAAVVDGQTHEEIAAAIGRKVRAASEIMRRLVVTGRVQVLRWPTGSASGGFYLRYWPAGADLPALPEKQPRVRVRKSKAKPKELHKKAGPKVGTLRKPRPVLVAASHVAKPAPFASAEPIMPKGLKVTVCPSGTDTRFKPSRVEPFFSALAPGNYLRTGSAIERAYGDKEPA